MTPIRELIDIPERVHRDDFVLRLAEGVAQPGETPRTYVVTQQLADAFDRALDLIKGALASGSSKAAYLHGSFGSGKSHFMAVLHLLQQLGFADVLQWWEARFERITLEDRNLPEISQTGPPICSRASR